MTNESFLQFNTAGDITVKAGHELQSRTINDYELVYFPKGGQTVYTTETEHYELKHPSIIMTRPQEVHRYTFDKDRSTRHMFIHFHPNAPMLQREYTLLHAHHPVITLDDQSIIPQLFSHIFTCFHHKPGRWRARAQFMFLTIIEELEVLLTTESSRIMSNPLPPQIYTVMQYIDQHLSENLTISRLAQSLDWSHEHFTRTFTQHIGVTPKGWINKRRIERASQLLLQSTSPIKEISKAVGYQDEYYFYRLFRKLMGMTPSNYRKKYTEAKFLGIAPPNDIERLYPLNHFFILNDGEED